jgi:hypothetical protein
VFLARLVNPAYGTIPAKAIVVFENVLENSIYFETNDKYYIL